MHMQHMHNAAFPYAAFIIFNESESIKITQLYFKL